jgi:eukaryotic-like serine/threonine-protein kinase
VTAEPSSLEPRAFRAAPARTDGGTLTPELESAAARRLGLLALMLIGASLVVRLIEELAGRPSRLGLGARVGLLAVSVTVSLALYIALASGRLGARRALALGPLYQVLQGFLVSVGFHATALVPGAEMRGWSPTAVWMLLYPLVVPGRPRRVLLATLATAAMDPLGLWVLVAAGTPPPPRPALGPMFLSTVMACIIAPLAARIVYGLAVEVKRAREMGAYRLVERLGAGGMGEVWRAEHRLLARSAAVKLIRPSSLGGGDGAQARELIKRFEREARATAALRSPHTIAVYDYGVAEDGTFHYVMELLEGYSLQALVDRFGPVPPERAVRLLRQACHSLAEAHASGLVHRDVKPANLFVCRLGLDVDFVKVLDFGLVKLQGPAAGPGAEALTVAGTLAGTPAFMPPEMALGAEPIDGRADIYALGCVAYWLLTGRTVFEGGNAMQMIVDHVRTRPLPPSERAEQPIPERLERLVLRCLEKEPAQRPATVAELSRELEALDLEPRWTEERARAWWSAHQPAAPGDPGPPTASFVGERTADFERRLHA